ncbi:hypothetical protein HBP99_09435 [Listeria booriae]|uniref:hypothetical protein n=1 Tax=Listeria booriae TaxID=1552123 RepID=UPI00162520C7|nr:hypothetical protein [Listeria booriae]MBC2368858.1 hypothetical protein [Listeria booriae]
MRVNSRIFRYFVYVFYSQIRYRLFIGLFLLLFILGMLYVNVIVFQQMPVDIYEGVSFNQVEEGVFIFPVIWLFIQMLPFYILGNVFSRSVDEFDINIVGILDGVRKSYLWSSKFMIITIFCVVYSAFLFMMASAIYPVVLGRALSMMLVLIYMSTIFCWLDYYFSSSVSFLAVAIFYGITIYIETPLFPLNAAMGARYEVMYLDYGMLLFVLEIMILLFLFLVGKLLYKNIEF